MPNPPVSLTDRGYARRQFRSKFETSEPFERLVRQMANRLTTNMRSITGNRVRSGRRRLHIVPAPEPRPEPVHPAERRMRDSGGPDDRAVYTCTCGYLFEAPVTASVSCPHCGAEQAW
jgi:rubrerythrin